MIDISLTFNFEGIVNVVKTHIHGGDKFVM
jgi:hypothetical protein